MLNELPLAYGHLEILPTIGTQVLFATQVVIFQIKVLIDLDIFKD
jgi:hypothetical protein